MRLSHIILALGAVAAQAVPARTLTKPHVEWAEPFIQITGSRELKSGGVIAGDLRRAMEQHMSVRRPEFAITSSSTGGKTVSTFTPRHGFRNSGVRFVILVNLFRLTGVRAIRGISPYY